MKGIVRARKLNRLWKTALEIILPWLVEMTIRGWIPQRVGRYRLIDQLTNWIGD